MFGGFNVGLGTCMRFKINKLVAIGKPLYVRERLSRTYDIAPYFISKFVGDFPTIVFMGTSMSMLPYFVVGLNTNDASKPLILCKRV